MLTELQRQGIDAAIDMLERRGWSNDQCLAAHLRRLVCEHDWKISETHRDGNAPWVCVKCGVAESSLAASAGQAEPTAWEKTRSLLITAVWAFSKIPAHERTADAAAQAVDAITDAGSPLSWLRNAAPTPAAAQQTCDRIVCEREGKCVDDDVARGERCQYLPAAAAQDERGAFAYPTIEHWITEIAGEREIGHVISEMTHMEVARQAFAAARAAASPVSGAAGDDARDAARYRFIRSQMRVGSVQTQLPLYRTLHWIGYEDCNDVRDADEAIDAEIERGERAGGK
jgi:hypothetical protein